MHVSVVGANAGEIRQCCFPGAGVRGHYEPPGLGAGTELWSSVMAVHVLNH